MSKSAPLTKGEDRDRKTGRWLKGCKPGPGGSVHAARLKKYKSAILDATSPAQAQRIFRRIAKIAEGKGTKKQPISCRDSLAAAKIYLEYVQGKPEHRYDPRQAMTVDGEQRRASYQPTAEEKRVLAQVLIAEADAEEGVIETEGEEVD